MKSILSFLTARRAYVAFALAVTLALLGSSSAPAGELLNLSTRGFVGTGENVLIGGIIVTGSGARHLLLRATGASSGVPGALADPILKLFDQEAQLLQENDDWRYGPERAIEATGDATGKLQPKDDYESAIIADVSPGQVTSIISGYAHSSGLALVEAFDLSSGSGSRLAEISTRGNVQTQDKILIGGFIIAQSSTKVLIRAIGPELSAFGVSSALQDTTLELRSADGALVEGNDDWKAGNRQAIEASGAPPKDDRESAIVQTLSPGNYTALVRGKNNTTGVGLVEIYRLE
jgi:hypothetical protein